MICKISLTSGHWNHFKNHFIFEFLILDSFFWWNSASKKWAAHDLPRFFSPRLNLWMWGSGQICFMTNKTNFQNLAPWSDKNSSVRCKFPKPKCRYLVDSGPKRKLAVFCRRIPGGWTSPKWRKGPLLGLMGHSFGPLFEHTRSQLGHSKLHKILASMSLGVPMCDRHSG